MPTADPGPPNALPTRRRSRKKPIAAICLVLFVTLICIITPLRYFDSDPPTDLEYTQSSPLTSTERVSLGSQGRGGLDESPDSIEAVNSRSPLRASVAPAQTYSDKFEDAVGKVVDSIGDVVLALFGFDEQDWFDFAHDGLTDHEEDELREMGFEGIGGGGGIRDGGGSTSGSGLSSWSESSLYVERTQSLHPSRPSAFGPHLLEKPLRGFLYPISLYTSSSYGCSLPSNSVVGPPRDGDEEWIALVQRGECPFSNKVRIAQDLGAKAVIFGDETEERGGIKGGKGLLTPWSPDDTKDIKVPSIFVSRASYLSLIKTWQDEQRIVLGGHEDDLVTAQGGGRDDGKYVGLEVVLSKDEIFAWPLLDLLFLLLFLPSLLTLLTVFTQRVRIARAQKAERAPKSAVAKLVVFKWGEPTPEKANAGAGLPSSSSPSTGGSAAAGRDEEREIGLTLQPRPLDDARDEDDERATESTSLLRPTRSTSTQPSTTSHRIGMSTTPTTLLARLRSFLPRRLRRRSSLSDLSPSASSTSLPLRGPNPRYPSLTDCSICLDSFVVNESIVIELPCSHLFHRDCAMSWLLTRKGVCPICRKSVMEDDDDEAEATAPATSSAAEE